MRYTALRANDAKRGWIWTRTDAPLVPGNPREARGVGQDLGSARADAALEDAEHSTLLGALAPKLAAGPGEVLAWDEVERDWA